MPSIRIKYFTDKIDKLTYVDGKSDWIDLRASEEVELKGGEFKLIPLGVAMELPKGYEAHLVPRSSTFKNYGILQTNSCGIIDRSYCGDEDMWRMPVYATRDTAVSYTHLFNPERAEKLFDQSEKFAKERYKYLNKLITLYGADENK